ncbi:hypothetical protein Avbf_07732 [Armadillidium vulgare]|nr:hypothetical protein Avbf_07732 [Armadillidium vulgare]
MHINKEIFCAITFIYYSTKDKMILSNSSYICLIWRTENLACGLGGSSYPGAVKRCNKQYLFNRASLESPEIRQMLSPKILIYPKFFYTNALNFIHKQWTPSLTCLNPVE